MLFPNTDNFSKLFFTDAANIVNIYTKMLTLVVAQQHDHTLFVYLSEQQISLCECA